MKTLIAIFALSLLMAVPAMAQIPIVSGTTNTPITFVMYDTDGAIVANPTITGAFYRKGTSTTATAMTTPTTGDVTNNTTTQFLIADEGTTITDGLAEENIDYIVTASDAETQRIRCVIKGPQATVAGIVDAIDTWFKAVTYFIQSPTGDTEHTNHETDPTPGSNPTRYTDAPTPGTSTTP